MLTESSWWAHILYSFFNLVVFLKMFVIKKKSPITLPHLILTPPLPTREISLQNITEKLSSLVISPVATSVFCDTVQFIFMELGKI